MNDEFHDDDATAARDIEALLNAAGPREMPPAELTAAVRAAVAEEWRGVVAARAPAAKRRLGPWFAAASVAVLAIGVWGVAPRLIAPDPALATVARVAGPVEIRRANDAAWSALPAAATLHAGDTLHTSADGRVALRRADGLELRIDAGTAVAFQSTDAARLESGRLYVDAGRADSGAGAFAVETALGNVRHLGTQYSVALVPGSLDVAVREGSVAVEHGHDPVVARAGERLSIAGDGSVSREAVGTHGEVWAWTQSVAPVFAIEGRTLDEFLAWAARETGRQLVYGSADAAREAQQTELKGSVDGLAPEAAVAAVMTTTPALQYRFAGARLRVERAAR